MELDQVQNHQISKSEQSNNKENVVLRTLVGDPTRHKTSLQHPPPTTPTVQQATPASMYTLETRYRPIPSKVLPKPAGTTLYYIESQKAEENSAPNLPITREEPDPIVAVEPEVPKIMEKEQESPPIVFLEPKIILQPVLYSIVGAKTRPIPYQPPMPTIKEVPSPILYTITGQPLRPASDMNPTIINVAQPVIDTSPILHTLIGGPRLQVRIQEPVKQVSQIPQQSSPNLYSIVGNPHLQPQIVEPVKQISQIPQQSSPNLYSIVGNPHLQPQIVEPVKQISQIPQQSSPNLYSIVGNPHLQPQIVEPVKQISQIPQQSAPTLYSVVGNPTPTPNITQIPTLDPLPSTQPVKVSSVRPAPILYTVVGETQVPNNIPKENRPPLASVKRHVNDATMHAVVGDPRIPQSMPLPHKTQLLPPLKQPQKQQQQTQQQQQPQKQQQPPTQTPSLYPLVGNPKSSPEENRDAPLKPLVRTKTPPPVRIPAQRISRSLERRSPPKPVTERVTSIPPIKNKRPAISKEPTIPKSETIFFPLPENERKPRHKKFRTTPRRNSPGQLHRKPFEPAQYNPLHLPDYISPYAYHPLKGYREETVYPSSLPIIVDHRTERKPRPTLSEPHYRAERKHPYNLWAPHSSERYPVRPKERPRLWDYEYQVQTDFDDDDDMDDLDSSRKNQHYRRFRPRTPWVPVW